MHKILNEPDSKRYPTARSADDRQIQHPRYAAAVAVRNVEDLTALLTFCHAIATVRDKPALSALLSNQLNEFFGIEDYVIHAISEDQQTHVPTLFDPNSPLAQHTVFKELLTRPNPVNDAVFNLIMASEDTLTFDIDERGRYPHCPVYLKTLKFLGWKKMIGVPIRTGDKIIAILIFRQSDHNKITLFSPHFKSLLSQLATAISNVNAYEKMTDQLAEINNYKIQLEEEKIYLKQEIAITHNYAELVGDSPEIQKIFRLIGQVASSECTVLLLGETGTGKELIARAIHNNSPRKHSMMVKVNCAALPENLIESELFGHEKGSFTGAIDRRLGKFELANHGTLFLDEIGEMPLALQVKLLRALQEREFERVGGRTIIKVNVRIIAATNRNLEREVAEGRFRSDLYYRLNVFPIISPPLRDRPDDILALTNFFINRFSKKAGRKMKTIGKNALQELLRYSWPGNIRELEHLIERSVLLTPGNTISHFDLPLAKETICPETNKQQFTIKSLDENERDHILKTLKHCRGKVAGTGGASELLGVPPSTLNSKMKKLGIRREHLA